MATVGEFVSTLTDNELKLTLPIDFQDVNAGDYEVVNKYNQLLANQDYQGAAKYRLEHSELEKYIFDAKKMNYLQTLALNAYLYAYKGGSVKEVTLEEYLQIGENYEPNTTYFVKDGDQAGLEGLGGYIFKEVTTLPSDAANKKNTIFIVG